MIPDRDTHFSDNLRRWMEAHGLTQADIASRLKAAGHPCNPSTVSCWLSGRRYPARRAQMALCSVIGASVNTLLWGRLKVAKGTKS
jgi:transcriptional regulator with XRE-family HTH domain